MTIPDKLSKALAMVGTPEGRRRLAEYLASIPFPHYEPAENGMLVRILENGERTVGRFVDGQFVPLDCDHR